MPTKEWEALEKIIAEIQKQLAPTAIVEHNKRVIGKSGRKRKLDVAISISIGTSPLFIIFDCKLHKKPVTLENVAAFSVQVEDVSANLGVMVSSSGYDGGAKAIAQQKNILLQIYRKAGETDWNALLGDQAWMMIIEAELRNPKVLTNLSSHPNQLVGLEFDTTIFDKDKNEHGSLESSFWESWKANGEKIGKIDATASFKDTFIQTIDGVLVQINNVVMLGEIVAKQYLVNLNFAKGDVLEDENRAIINYRSLESKAVDWTEIVKNQIGKELSEEEYQQIRNQPKAFSESLSKDKKYFRVVIQQKLKR